MFFSRQQSLRDLAEVQDQLRRSSFDSSVGSDVDPAHKAPLPFTLPDTSTGLVSAATTTAIHTSLHTGTIDTEAHTPFPVEEVQAEKESSDSPVTQGSVSSLSTASSGTPGKMDVRIRSA